MRKIIFVLCFSCIVYGSNSVFEAHLEFNFNGKQQLLAEGSISGEYIDSDLEYDVENSLTPSVQFGGFITKNIVVGVGAKYQLPRKLNGLDGWFSFIPAYFFVKGIFSNSEYLKPYIIGQFGYNHFIGDEDYKGLAILTGKHYYGLGVGITLLNHLDLAFLYSVNSGSYHLDYMASSLDADIEYSKISFLFGFTK